MYISVIYTCELTCASFQVKSLELFFTMVVLTSYSCLNSCIVKLIEQCFPVSILPHTCVHTNLFYRVRVVLFCDVCLLINVQKKDVSRVNEIPYY